jgi:hypothetical protein
MDDRRRSAALSLGGPGDDRRLLTGGSCPSAGGSVPVTGKRDGAWTDEGFGPNKFGLGIVTFLLGVGFWLVGFVVLGLLFVLAASAADVAGRLAARQERR